MEKMRAYYNEFDPKAAAWLRQLIKNGNITPGEVDERSIEEVEPADLVGFDRVHWFAGVGTWDYCLNNSGWGDKPVWTASLPCQPFSAAGKGLGKADERHLLPHFLELVRQCKPLAIFGEQVERAINYGWLDDLQANMETEGYAVGHVVLGAHSVNAAHIRQRLYWVADNSGAGYQEQPGKRGIPQKTNEHDARKDFAGSGWMGDSEHDGCVASTFEGSDGSTICNSEARTYSTSESEGTNSPESLSWIYCGDKKYRPIKPGILPLVDGITRGMVHSSDTSEQITANATQEARVMRLKGYGNAIQAQTAIAFINAYMGIK